MSTMSDPPHLSSGARDEDREAWRRTPVRAVVPEPLERALQARALVRQQARLASRTSRAADLL